MNYLNYLSSYSSSTVAMKHYATAYAYNKLMKKAGNFRTKTNVSVYKTAIRNLFLSKGQATTFHKGKVARTRYRLTTNSHTILVNSDYGSNAEWTVSY